MDRKYLHESLEASLLLCEIAEFTAKHGKLISDQQVKDATAMGIEINPSEIKFSTPWYINIAKEYLEKGIVLPPITQLNLYQAGDPSEFNPSGLFRGTKNFKSGKVGNYKPILQKDMVMSYIKSKPSLLELIADAKRLAKEINAEYYGPSEAKLQEILLAWSNTEFKDADAELSRLNIEADGDLTRTQKVVLFREHVACTNKAISAIANSTDLKQKALAANVKIADGLVGIADALVGITGKLGGIAQNNQALAEESTEDTANLNKLMTNQSEMATSIFEPPLEQEPEEEAETTTSPIAKFKAAFFPPTPGKKWPVAPPNITPKPKQSSATPSRPKSNRKKMRPAVLTYPKK